MGLLGKQAGEHSQPCCTNGVLSPMPDHRPAHQVAVTVPSSSHSLLILSFGLTEQGAGSQRAQPQPWLPALTGLLRVAASQEPCGTPETSGKSVPGSGREKRSLFLSVPAPTHLRKSIYASMYSFLCWPTPLRAHSVTQHGRCVVRDTSAGLITASHAGNCLWVRCWSD